MNRFYPLVADRAGHRCEYCHAPELVFNFPFEIEHIIPTYLGGNDIESNLALACRSCNLRKGIRTQGIAPDSKVEIPLFNPRKDTWSQHFEVDISSGQLIGKTPTGELTIATLKMNSQTQVTARQIWVHLNIFP